MNYLQQLLLHSRVTCWMMLLFSIVSVSSISSSFSDSTVTNQNSSRNEWTSFFYRSWHNTPGDWVVAPRSVSMTNTAAPVCWLVALHHSVVGVQRLNEAYIARTDPRSSLWTKWLSPEQILDLLQTPVEHHDKLLSFFTDRGATLIESYGDALRFCAPIAATEAVFHTRLQHFVHRRTGQHVVRHLGHLHLHKDIAAIVALVEGLSLFPIETRLPLRRQQQQRSQQQQQQQNQQRREDLSAVGLPLNVPQTARLLYNVPSLSTESTKKRGQRKLRKESFVVPNASPSASSPTQAFITIGPASYSPVDLLTFGQITSLPVRPYAFVYNNSAHAGTSFEEGSLDAQWLAGTNADESIENQLWRTEENAWIYGFALELAMSPEIPDILSISFAWDESEACGSVVHGNCTGITNAQYIARANVELMKAGLRGATLLAGSGDGGASGSNDAFCSSKQLKPEFPASSPYVTAVGATRLYSPRAGLIGPLPPICQPLKPLTTSPSSSPGRLGEQQQQLYACSSGGDERPVSSLNTHTADGDAGYACGGGFSALAARPAYQDKVVPRYLKTTPASTLPTGHFNSQGRGYPDVTALGSDMLEVLDGVAVITGGTSAATPLFAALLSMLNARKRAITGSSLGPANTFLYQLQEAVPACFRDMETGDNIRRSGSGAFNLTCMGFQASKGWDPVSGLGALDVTCAMQYLEKTAAMAGQGTQRV